MIASNSYSSAQAAYQKNCYPLGVYSEASMIGFAMYALDPDEGSPWIYRFMIASAHQGKGYGRAALRQLIEFIQETESAGQISLSYKQDNDPARKLYASAGFVETGEIIEEEVVARLKTPARQK